MKKISILFLIIVILFLSGCGGSDFKSTTKVLKVFEIDTGDISIFELDNDYRHIKIFDTNDSFEAYISDINERPLAEGDRSSMLPLLNANIDFEKNNLLIFDYGGWLSGNGFNEKIYEVSESSVAIDIKSNPVDYNVVPKSWIIIIHGYIVDKSVKEIYLNDKYIINFDKIGYTKIDK